MGVRVERDRGVAVGEAGADQGIEETPRWVVAWGRIELGRRGVSSGG